MPVSDDFLDYVIEQFEALGVVRARRMFGGAGIYSADTMFALVADDVLYLKVDDSNRPDFERAGMKPFRPYENKATVMPYYEVPADALEDAEELARWAGRALQAARSKKKKKA